MEGGRCEEGCEAGEEGRRLRLGGRRNAVREMTGDEVRTGQRWIDHAESIGAPLSEPVAAAG